MKYNKQVVAQMMKEFIEDWAKTLNYEQLGHLGLMVESSPRFDLTSQEFNAILLSVIGPMMNNIPKEHQEAINQTLTDKFVKVRKEIVKKRLLDEEE